MEINDPIYGATEIAEPVLLEVLEEPAMLRLKGVDQNSVGGIAQKPWGKFTRFDHSVGVMILIKRLGGNLEEQIAGLLHDISHTAFSHAMDYVFDSAMVQDFHEKHLQRIVNKSNIPRVLKKYGYDTARILDHHNFPILEQDLPALCADRVDYALKTFTTSLQLPLSEISQLLADLTVSGRQIVFQNKRLAKRFAELFLRADFEVWGGSAFGNTVYYLFSQIVKKAYERGEITLDDFFTTDEEFMSKLGSESLNEVAKLRNMKLAVVSGNDPFDLHLNGKIRYVDPPVFEGGKTQKLSEIDAEFKARLSEFLTRRKAGNYVKITI